MKYSNELKVGVAIMLATVIFILGVRYFEDLPLFGGTFDLETEFANAGGLIAGNVVRVNGVTVGSIDEVLINPENNRVKILFHVEENVPVREGSVTYVSGLDALGVVRMDLELGPPDAPMIPNRGFVPSRPQNDLLSSMSKKAPGLVDGVDSVLVKLDAVLGSTRAFMDGSSDDLAQTLVSVRGSVGSLDAMLRSERVRISSVLQNVDTLTAGLGKALGPDGDSLAATLSGLNSALVRLDATLLSLNATATSVNAILARIEAGEGTLGMLVNDPGLYLRADSTLSSLQALLDDFRLRPGKYLSEMRLIDVF